MPQVTNRFGLSRTIPLPIKREVRQRDGFGCVVCGCAIYQYEHLEPSFTDAHEHRAEGIVLLCGRCHDRKTRGFLSLETVKSAAARPCCKETGFSFGEFDLGARCPIIRVGATEFHSVKTLIEISGEPILSILQPEALGLPFRINAFVTDRDGNSILEIVENEWRAPTYNWDVETGGGCITVRAGPRQVALKLRTAPPTTLIVERLDMQHRGTTIRCLDGTNLELIKRNGAKAASVTLSNCAFQGFAIGVLADRGGLALGVNARPGRNMRCRCGTGLRYKHCCGSYGDETSEH
jgi:hypothetical protein